MKKTKKVIFKKVPVSESILGTSGGNYIAKGEGFYISYQPFKNGEGRLPTLERLVTAFTGDERTDDETALYDHETWRILWGDWRKEYRELIPKGLEACIEFYESKKDEYGCTKWSTDES